MFIVAVLEAATGPEVEATALAADLQVTQWEATNLLRGPLPWVVLRTADEPRALTLRDALRGRGHRVAMGDPARLPASTALRDFQLHEDAFVAVGPTGTLDRLPWAQVTALVRATVELKEASVEVTRERTFSVGRAVLTSGLSNTTVVKKEREVVTQSRVPALYVFRREGGPWLATQERCRYEGLGQALKPSRLENFNTLVRLLRERAPHARFDERLVQARGLSPEDLDLYAHLVARG